MVKFDVTEQEGQVIKAIVERAVRMDLLHDDRLSLSMDITACHCNGTPLRLQELLEAEDGSFGHDIGGIQRFIDRKTGKLSVRFHPRYSKPVEGEL